MTRRTRIALWSFGVVVALGIVAAGGVLTVLQTDWGHERIRRVVVSSANDLFAGRATLYIGKLGGGLNGRFTVDSVALVDNKGKTVASVSHLEADASLTGFLTGNIHVTRLLVVRPYVLLEQSDSGWNVGRLTAARQPGSTPSRSTLAIALDQSEVQDGHLVMLQPDSLPKLPPQRRDFSKINLVIGNTRVLPLESGGGIAPLTSFSVESSRPPIPLRQSTGTVHWWHDSLALDFPLIRLPATHASVKGSINWAKKGPARIDLRIHGDTIALEDVAWATTMIPKHGDASTELRILSAADPHTLEYLLTNLDMRATRSRLTGALNVAVGDKVAVTDLALEAQPVDLDLVRELLGDSVPPKVWQGSLAGTIKGRGGPITAMRFDDIQLAFTDRRAGGAVSHVAASGELAVLPTATELHEFDLHLADLDVHTLGAAIRMADSLHGVLSGRLVLDGPTRNINFHDLALVHIDGDRPRSWFSGEGRLATNSATEWLVANLSLDTIAVATIARDRTTMPLRGTLNGTLELHATRDTMTIATLLKAGAGSVRFNGATLLDSTRTWLKGFATMQAFDPRVLIARKDIPVLRLSGRAGVDVEGPTGHIDAHADISLDSTSIIGDSHIALGHVRAGVDSTGFHVDTAEVHAQDWRVSARGRIAKTGATHDSLFFKVEFDSLAPLRALVLDSAGAAIADSLHGAVGIAGTLAGSLDTLALTADFGVRDGRFDGATVRRATGHVALTGLPSKATGTFTATADSAAYGGFTASRVSARADVRDGRTGHVTTDIASGDTLATRIVADLERAGDTTRVALDSLGLIIASNDWRLAKPTHLTFSPGRIVIDSTVLRSSHGATLAVRATLPDANAVDGNLFVDGFGPAELAYLHLFSPDFEGRLQASVALTGTRDAPKMAFTVGFDSARVNERPAPSLALKGTYENRRAQVDARGTHAGREMISIIANVPIDLTLRSVPKRLLDDSLTLKIKADSATLAGLEAVIPGVEALKGQLTANLDVRGTWKQVTGKGTLSVRDGEFVLPKYGTVVKSMSMDDTVATDSLRVHMRMTDADSPKDVMTVDGALWLVDSKWHSDVTSIGRSFRLLDDPSLATGDANWLVHLTGPLSSLSLEGDLAILSGTLVLGRQRNVRPLLADTLSSDVQGAVRRATISSLRILLGTDVRLKSRAANVKLAGEVEISGPFKDPYVDGEFSADRGTYLVDLGPFKRTFLVDSGTVRLAGKLEIPAVINLWTSYLVRRTDQEDMTIIARLTGTTDAPRLTLSSTDVGASVAQSEIISYLIFGAPSFGSQLSQQGLQGSAAAVLGPSLGGVLEGAIGGSVPFFQTLQISTIASAGPNVLSSAVESALNSFAISGGRQLGSESYLTLSGGVCRTSRLASTQSPPSWGSISVEYRPKNKMGAVTSYAPVTSPCYGLGRYQFGLDLFKDWKF